MKSKSRVFAFAWWNNGQRGGREEEKRLYCIDVNFFEFELFFEDEFARFCKYVYFISRLCRKGRRATFRDPGVFNVFS